MGVTPLEWQEIVRRTMKQQLLQFQHSFEKDGRNYDKKKTERERIMYNYKIVEQVSRKKKSMSGILRKVMVIFAVFFVVLGITISQSFMLAGFLLAGLYFVL